MRVTPLGCKSEMLRLMSKTWIIRSVTGESQEFNLLDLGWTFEFHNDSNSNGTCHYSRTDNNNILLLSEWLINNTKRPMIKWVDIMLHEIAHAIDCEIRGCSDHSDIWVNIAHQIGCSGEITTFARHKRGVYPIYIVWCSNCRTEVHLNSVGNEIRKGEVSCAHCAPNNFNSNYILQWRPNPDHIHDKSIQSSLYKYNDYKLGRTK